MSRKNPSNLSSIHLQQPQPHPQNLQIYLRIKPNLTHPQQPQSIHKVSDRKVQMICPYYVDVEKGYYYDHVFDRTVTNSELFERTMVGPIQNALNGFNSTVLICGMTGSGKTYTMFGEMEAGDGSEEGEGVVFQALGRLFAELRAEQQVKSKLYLSFYEIYNETIRDLLREGGQNLNIVEDPQKGTVINDLCEFPIQTQTAAKQLLTEGLLRRSMDATRTNQVSSRSHAIVQLQLKRFIDKNSKVQQSKMFLIDLAGNQKSHNNLNKRFVQGVNINKSLLTLGKCISILAQQKKNSFVPFRDSKLTRILKQSLGGNSKTVMIACVSSSKSHYEQTLNTLKFSSVAKNVRNRASRNIREVNKSDLSSTGFVVNENQQEDKQLFELLTGLVSNIEEKFRVEGIIRNLQVAREGNRAEEGQGRVIAGLLGEVEEERSKVIEHGENQYNQLIEFIFQRRQTNASQLQKTITQQKKQIQSLMAQKQSLSKQLTQQTSLLTSLRHQHSLQQSLPNNNTNKKQSLPYEPKPRMTRFTLDKRQSSIANPNSSTSTKRAQSTLGLSTVNNSVRTTNRGDEDDKENMGARRMTKNQKKPKEVLIDLNPKREALEARDKSLKNTERERQGEHLEMSPQEEALFRKLKISHSDLRSTSRLKSHSSERSLIHSKSQTRKFNGRLKI